MSVCFKNENKLLKRSSWAEEPVIYLSGFFYFSPVWSCHELYFYFTPLLRDRFLRRAARLLRKTCSSSADRSNTLTTWLSFYSCLFYFFFCLAWSLWSYGSWGSPLREGYFRDMGRMGYGGPQYSLVARSAERKRVIRWWQLIWANLGGDEDVGGSGPLSEAHEGDIPAPLFFSHGLFFPQSVPEIFSLLSILIL